MEIDEWQYETEGGRHVLYSYHGEHPELRGYLLRVSKTAKFKGFQDHISKLQLLLYPFVQPGKSIRLEIDFLKQLIQKAPSKSWAACPDQDGNLVRDFRSDCTFCVELKPKAGVTAVSPLVDPRRRQKFQTPRYQLLQQVYKLGKLRKTWMADVFHPSNYDPRDLFSRDLARCKRAIRALWASPQNNLKLWDQNRNDVLHRSLPGVDDCVDVRFFETVVGTVLATEDVLAPKLLGLQKQDVIDADGAILIYNRLVQICGSPEKAEDLVDAGGCSKVGLLPGSRLDEYVTLVKGLANIQRLRMANQSELDEFRRRALRLIEEFSSDDCVHLLHKYLLSLVACDVSVFIALRVMDRAFPLISRNDSVSCQIVEMQSGNDPGCLQVSVVEADGRVVSQARCYYDIQVIDLDQKPASKLRSRSSKEEWFNDVGDQRESL